MMKNSYFLRFLTSRKYNINKQLDLESTKNHNTGGGGAEGQGGRAGGIPAPGLLPKNQHGHQQHHQDHHHHRLRPIPEADLEFWHARVQISGIASEVISGSPSRQVSKFEISLPGPRR